eukprot:TRINITY_DN1735_c0_g6_i1.p1 TRINITY_DN1735_c0_g6~~TRINITY_DN1735_c0_g6_i1.p1  ORF type:complete len:115 (-),score=15.73 TRINITY_DN1735_c0_g6_i1:141-485(-)
MIASSIRDNINLTSFTFEYKSDVNLFEVISEIDLAVKGNKKLRTFIFRVPHAEETKCVSEMMSLSAIKETSGNLVEFDVAHNNLGVEGIKYVTHAIKFNKNLLTLNIGMLQQIL